MTMTRRGLRHIKMCLELHFSTYNHVGNGNGEIQEEEKDMNTQVYFFFYSFFLYCTNCNLQTMYDVPVALPPPYQHPWPHTDEPEPPIFYHCCPFLSEPPIFHHNNLFSTTTDYFSLQLPIYHQNCSFSDSIFNQKLSMNFSIGNLFY